VHDFLSCISIPSTELYSISSHRKTGTYVAGSKLVFQNVEGSQFNISCFAPPLVSTDCEAVLCLDFLRHGHLKTFIRNLQFSLLPCASVTFEFTTLGPSVAYFNTPFILCALPYLPRKHIRLRDHPSSSRRTSNPLMMSLNHFIGLATTGPSPLIIESVQNVSIEYAEILNSVALGLQDNRQRRNSIIDQFGREFWLEHRFLTDWESSLLTAGYLTRWVVTARKRGL